MSAKDETTLTEDDVRREHARSVRAAPHWAYLVGVIGGGLAGMTVFLALLGAAHGG